MCRLVDSYDRAQVLCARPRALAGRNADLAVVRRRAAARHLYGGLDANERHARADLDDVHAAVGRVRGGETLPDGEVTRSAHHPDDDRRGGALHAGATATDHPATIRRTSGTRAPRAFPSWVSGRIFPISEELITCEPFEIPDHFPRIGGMDFGWDHPFAAVELAWDRDAGHHLCHQGAPAAGSNASRFMPPPSLLGHEAALGLAA